MHVVIVTCTRRRAFKRLGPTPATLSAQHVDLHLAKVLNKPPNNAVAPHPKRHPANSLSICSLADKAHNGLAVKLYYRAEAGNHSG